MALNEETGAYNMGEGCAVHGDEHMKECSMCGAEFCRLCHPRTTVCPDCAEQSDDDEELEEEEEGEEEEEDEEEDEEKGFTDDYGDESRRSF